MLDVVFREDESRIRRDRGAQTMAILRQFAPNPLRKDETKRLSLRMERKRAGRDEAFLAQVVGIQNALTLPGPASYLPQPRGARAFGFYTHHLDLYV